MANEHSPARVVVGVLATVLIAFCAWSAFQYSQGDDPLAFLGSDALRTVESSDAAAISVDADQAATVSGTLVGWSLSDSLDAADSMRARGWGAAPDRSSYQPWAFRSSDAWALTLVVCLVGLCALLGWVACSQYRFYPTMSVLLPWWGYAPYALLSLLPCILHAKEAISWRS